jgi:hypothetical protein
LFSDRGLANFPLEAGKAINAPSYAAEFGGIGLEPPTRNSAEPQDGRPFEVGKIRHMAFDGQAIEFFAKRFDCVNPQSGIRNPQWPLDSSKVFEFE